MPFGVEQYGITYGLDATTLARLETGFDEIRAIEGWENFRIPYYVWQYVGQTERDRFLSWLQTALWTTRTGDLPSSVSKSMHMVFCFALMVLSEWWRDNDDKPTLTALYASLTADWGIPSGSLSLDDEYENGEGIEITVSHPSGVTALDTNYFWFCDFLPETWDDTYVYLVIGTVAGDELELLTDTDEAEYCYLYDNISDETDYDANWDDLGVVAKWPTLINGAHEVISARATFKDFGLMDGSFETSVSFDEGSQVQVVKGNTILFTGIVTGVKLSLVDGVYSVSVADPVSAGGGEVEFSSGNAISALQEAIENHGGSLETDMETEETVVYTEKTVDAWQFFRAASYSVGGVLQYGKNGVYRLVEAGEGHGITDAEVIGDDNPTVEERTKEYANRVAATIDEVWQEEAVENTLETFSGSGAYVSIVRFGERVLSETVHFNAGEGGKSTTYGYNASGCRISISEETDDGTGDGAEKRTRVVSVTGISEEGNQYTWTEQIKTYRYVYNYGSESWGFEQQGQTDIEWHVNLNGVSHVEEIEWGLYPVGSGVSIPQTEGEGEDETVVQVSVPTCPEYVSEGLYRRYRWVATVVSNPTAGPLEGYTTCAEYIWTFLGLKPYAEGFWNACAILGWWRKPSGSTKSYTVPKLEMYAPKDTNEVHIIAQAEDPASIESIGQHEYECQAVALDKETGMQAFALGVLHEMSRIRKALIAVPMGSYLPHDTVIWRSMEWHVEQVTVDSDRACDALELETQSTLERLSSALSKEPVTWVEDVRNAINKRVAQYANVARGRILSQVGFRRYMVQSEGKAEPVEAKALTDEPNLIGGSVLLVRPTGKNQPWTLLSLSKEQGILMPGTVQENITPAVEITPEITAFTASEYEVPVFRVATLEWTFGSTSFVDMGVEIDPGDGTDTYEVLGADEGSTEFTPASNVGEITPKIRSFCMVFGTRAYGDWVELDAPLDIVGPAVASIEVENDADGIVFAGYQYQIALTYNAEFTAGQLKNLQVSYNGGSSWSTYTSGIEGTGETKLKTWATEDIGETSVQAKMTFTQQNGEDWTGDPITLPIEITAHDGETEGAIGTHEYYYFPRGACSLTNDWATLPGTETVCDAGIGGSRIPFELEFDVDPSSGTGEVTLNMPTKYTDEASNAAAALGFRVYPSGGNTRVTLVTTSTYWAWADINGEPILSEWKRYWEVQTGLAAGTVKFIADTGANLGLPPAYFSQAGFAIAMYWNDVFICATDATMAGTTYKYFFPNDITGATSEDPGPYRYVRAIRTITGSGPISNVSLDFTKALIDRLNIEGGSWSSSAGYVPTCMHNMPESGCEFTWTEPE